MRRFISFRDFDWLLLGLVLLLSVISIFEIYSATLHTKFVGFETKQIFWLIGGLAAMFNLFSGGALENCAVFSLGVMPYISASIMMQLLSAVTRRNRLASPRVWITVVMRSPPAGLPAA